MLVFDLNCLLLRKRFRAHSLVNYILIFYILYILSLRSRNILNINNLIDFLWRSNWIFNIVLNDFVVIYYKRNLFAKIGVLYTIYYIILCLIINLIMIFKMRISGLIFKIWNIKFLYCFLARIFLHFILDKTVSWITFCHSL